MATDDDLAMKLRISQLAGRINRHKNQQDGSDVAAPARYSPYNRHENYRGNSYGYRGRAPVRNRSRVFNGAGKENNNFGEESGTTSDASTASWPRPHHSHHRRSHQYQSQQYLKQQYQNQIVNNQANQPRINLDPRQQYYAKKDNLESRKLMNYLLNQNQDKIDINGIHFFVVKGGRKLVKEPGDNHPVNDTPQVHTVADVKFRRTKHGNLLRETTVQAHRHSAPFRKTDVPCKVFTSTGSCQNGPHCKYVHDPHKVAACKDFLQKGTCYHGDACDLSHDLTPERTPHCLHFAMDRCTKSDCKYTHVKVSSGAPVCRAFGRYGYCDKGAECADRHVYECPDFANTGVCKDKHCKLLHRERASVLRNATNNVVLDDLSSDEGESEDGQDVDSDEMDEFIGQDDTMDFNVAAQRDFIEL